MNILAEATGYAPEYKAGAEEMLHAILQFFVSLGHKCTVLAKKGSNVNYGVIDGVEIYYNDISSLLRDQKYSEADWVFTYLDSTEISIEYCKKYNKPLAHIMHFDWASRNINLDYKNCQLLIFNSHAMLEKGGINGVINTVIHPPVWIDKYRVNRDNARYITLINVNKNKGGHILPHLAELLPEYEFLGVEGSYGDQIKKEGIPNLTYLPPQSDIREVYRQTKLLLVLSNIETWGRVAIEAGVSGIPVVSTETLGLKEALGSAGIFVNRNNVFNIVKNIKEIMTKSYNEYANLIQNRAKELQQICRVQLTNTMDFMERFLNKDFNSIGENGELYCSDNVNNLIQYSKQNMKPFLPRRGNDLPILYQLTKDIFNLKTDFQAPWREFKNPIICKVIKSIHHNNKTYRQGDTVILEEEDLNNFKPGMIERY